MRISFHSFDEFNTDLISCHSLVLTAFSFPFSFSISFFSFRFSLSFLSLIPFCPGFGILRSHPQYHGFHNHPSVGVYMDRNQLDC